MSDTKLFTVLVVACLVFGLAVGGLVYLLAESNSQTFTIGCATKGANIYQKSTKDGKYTTIWCVKNGKVVP